MEQKELKESTLINLRSVAQSCKGGLPLSNLQNDYKKLIGRTIPFNSLGYGSLEEFIRDIPDVIRLKRNPNGALFVEAVTDASTSHLASLISRQKGPSSKKMSKPLPPFAKRSASSSSSSSIKSEVSNSNSQAPATIKDVLPDETSSLLKEIQNLKIKLKKEENRNDYLSAEVTKLSSLVRIGDEILSVEKKKVQQLETQLEDLQKKMVLKYCAVNGVKWNENLELQNKAELLDWNDNLLKTSLPKSIASSQASERNPPISQIDFIGIHKEQCIQVNDLKNQVKQQREHMTILRKELKQQQLQINSLTIQVEKLSSESPKAEMDMDCLMQMVLKHLLEPHQNGQTASCDSSVSNDLVANSKKNHFVGHENMELLPLAQAISEKPCIRVEDYPSAKPVVKGANRKKRKKNKKTQLL